jgi:hypothetical protein
VGIDGSRPPMQLLGIRMIFGIGQDAGNDTALPCHAQTLLDAKFLNTVHGSPVLILTP